MTSEPRTGEPRTEAGRALLSGWDVDELDLVSLVLGMRDRILAIEAEAYAECELAGHMGATVGGSPSAGPGIDVDLLREAFRLAYVTDGAAISTVAAEYNRLRGAAPSADAGVREPHHPSSCEMCADERDAQIDSRCAYISWFPNADGTRDRCVRAVGHDAIGNSSEVLMHTFEEKGPAPRDDGALAEPQPTDLQAWYVQVRVDWERHWQGRYDHRYGQDYAAFVGERLRTDFRLEGPNTAGYVPGAGAAPAPDAGDREPALTCRWCGQTDWVDRKTIAALADAYPAPRDDGALAEPGPTLREALETALKQWEMYADNDRTISRVWLADGPDHEAALYRWCLRALRADRAPAPDAAIDVERLRVAMRNVAAGRVTNRLGESDVDAVARAYQEAGG